MATTKSTTPRSRTAKPKTPRAKADQSLTARTSRTIKERPYTSAAIATGAVTAVAAVAAATAGAIYLSRRDKSLAETGDELATRVKGGLSSASEKIKDFAARGSEMLKGNEGTDARSQQEIAEEALTLKQTGATGHALDDLAGEQIKAGTVAY
ncbi:MAG: hypothetical protein M3Q57_04480 [Pseudomonadota bacterium]|nr:hypothetical protein [Pseudomonadota bacterium]